MKYRVQCDLGFDTQEQAATIFNKIIEARENGELKNISEKETFNANIHKCFHDEPENKPCEPIRKLEFGDLMETEPIK